MAHLFGRSRWVSLCLAFAACQPAPASNAKPAASHAGDKPAFIQGAVPVTPFVAEQQLLAGDARVVVYVGATWCEPCQRFHRALEAGALDSALRGVRFIEYDSGDAKAELQAAGYRSRLIPLFALPEADGRASDHKEEGSIKGEGAVQNILPRLQALLARNSRP
jgi:thiol-disulfide isomerase/thioredoxin